MPWSTPESLVRGVGAAATIHHRVTPTCDTGAVRDTATTDPSRPRLALVRSTPEAPHDPAETGRRVAGEVALVVAGTAEDTLSGAPLALPLALSVCMARNELEADGLVAAMQLLRRAILAVSRLDQSCEPVPLGAGDARMAALFFAKYLHGLFDRAAEATGVARDTLALSAVAQLRAS